MSEKTIVVSAKTAAEAIEQALLEMQLTQDQVEIEVLDEGTRGLLGLGARPARVQVTKIITPESRTMDFLEQLIDYLNVSNTLDIQSQWQEDVFKIHVYGDQSGTLIGHRGETLDAMQYLCSIVMNRSQEDYTRVMLDVENYRVRREETLIQLSRKMADKAARTHRRVTLEPMNPYERRIVHFALQDHPRVTTISEGAEPNRRVTILPR